MKHSLSQEYKKQSAFEKNSRAVLRQLGLQIVLFLIAIVNLFPIVWIVSIALDERGLPTYSELVLYPQNPTFNAFEQLLLEPFETLSSATNQLYFTQLLSNSLFVALGTAMLSVGLGASAAYAFSRFKFIGRQAGMLGFIVLLMMPATGTLIPLIAIFSLLRIHVVFSVLAPAIFYGALMALLTYGFISGVRSMFKMQIFQQKELRYVPVVLTLIFSFSLIYLAWILMFMNSSVYNDGIRAELRSLNYYRDNISEARKNIPKTEDNIVRTERNLASARIDAARLTDELNSAAEDFPGSYELYNDLSSLTNGVGRNAVGGNALLLDSVYETTDVQFIIETGINGDVADLESKLEAFKQELVDTKKSIVVNEKAWAEARAPYEEQRNEAITRLLPYALASYIAALVIAGLYWRLGIPNITRDDKKSWGLNLNGLGNLKLGSLARRDQLSTMLLIGYALITLIVAGAWFDVNYKSPTEAVGLDGGGLWYDIRLSFRSEDSIREDIEPYTERDRLEYSFAQLENEGFQPYLDMTLAEFNEINTMLDELEPIHANLDAETDYTKIDLNANDITARLERLSIDYRSLYSVNDLDDLGDNQENELRQLILDAELLAINIDYKRLYGDRNAETRPSISFNDLDRKQRIDLRNRVKSVIKSDLKSIQSRYDSLRRSLGQTRANDNIYFLQINADFAQLNLLNNENLKTDLTAILEKRRNDLTEELQLADTNDVAVATSNFTQALNSLPNDINERDRLLKEFRVRSSNSGNVTETLKITLFGLIIAYGSGALPFAIWNLKGYFDTIPKDLEEAALVDGATLVSTFFRIIVPLSLPALAITTLFGFMTGWTEFILATQFLTAGDIDRTTLAMALRGIAGGGTTQAEPDYTKFAAMSIMMAIPVMSLFYIFQRWIVSGLTVGGVKG